MFLFNEKNQAWFCGKEGMREALATVASCSSWFCSVTTQLDSSVSYDTKLCTTKRPSLLSTAVHLDNHRINVLTVLLPWLWRACTEGPTHAISVARLPLHCPSLHVLGVELSPEPAEHCPWQQPAPKSWGKNSVMPMCLLLTSIRGKSRKSRSAFQLPSCSKLCQTFGPIFSLPPHWEKQLTGFLSLVIFRMIRYHSFTFDTFFERSLLCRLSKAAHLYLRPHLYSNKEHSLPSSRF